MSTPPDRLPRVGVVAIGRNEGERLRACLRSVAGISPRVYVDSGSSDGSAELAEAEGVLAIRLTSPPPFTAARGRNSGLTALVAQEPELEFVQMIDGDCTLAPDWMEAGVAELRASSDIAAVFGRLSEKNRDSFYNRMCEAEWSGPIGEVASCGGIALFRVEALSQSGGYAETMAAGEEPELCLRIRRKGWRIVRIDVDMAVHDAAMSRFGEWWRRAGRSGGAFAELNRRHGDDGNPIWRRQLASIVAWAAVIPALIVAAAALAAAGFAAGWLIVLGLLLLYPLQVARIAGKEHHLAGRDAYARAVLLMLGKIAQLGGALRYWREELRRSPR